MAGLAGYDRIWLDMDGIWPGLGRLWTALAGYDWVWPGLRLGGIEQNQFDSLVELVRSVTIVPSADRWNWNLESTGIFLVASARRRIDEICLPNIGEETRWRVTPSTRSSRSGDHRSSRRDSTEYDRCEGRVVSRRYSDDSDYRDSSEPLPRHGRDYSHSMTTSF
ncbi:hypothetical protein Tco_1351255 [Tanacetum coccineum]